MCHMELDDMSNNARNYQYAKKSREFLEYGSRKSFVQQHSPYSENLTLGGKFPDLSHIFMRL